MYHLQTFVTIFTQNLSPWYWETGAHVFSVKLWSVKDISDVLRKLLRDKNTSFVIEKSKSMNSLHWSLIYCQYPKCIPLPNINSTLEQKKCPHTVLYINLVIYPPEGQHIDQLIPERVTIITLLMNYLTLLGNIHNEMASQRSAQLIHLTFSFTSSLITAIITF